MRHVGAGGHPFSATVTRDHRVLVHWQGRPVRTLVGEQARRVIDALRDAHDAAAVQAVLARAAAGYAPGEA